MTRLGALGGRLALGLLGWLLGTGVPASAEAAERRPLPDYDGRPDRTTPGDVALWVPRIVFLPLYLTSEYIVRRPLGFLVTEAERAQLPAVLYDFFAFGPDHKAGIIPTAFIDFGFLPSVGFYAFWDDAGFDGHDLRLHGSTWGSQWLKGTATDRIRLTSTQSLTFAGTGTRRPDYAFYGLGPDSKKQNLGRYGADSVEASVTLRSNVWGSSTIEGATGYRSFEFRPGRYLNDLSVDERVAAGVYPEPPGYHDGYGAGFSHLRVVLDSRPRKGGSATGARLELDAEAGTALRDAPASGWLRSGATLGGTLDLGDSGRVVGLSLSTALADPLGTRAVPFTELVMLGGPNLMPGFREGRLSDRTAAVATLRYSWPIWLWLNGSLQAAAGNVFGSGFSGFALSKARLSGAIGVESAGSRDSVFQLLFGAGTETFENGAKIDSLRLSIGARSGF
jgi:hypothetical protein